MGRRYSENDYYKKVIEKKLYEDDVLYDETHWMDELEEEEEKWAQEHPEEAFHNYMVSMIKGQMSIGGRPLGSMDDQVDGLKRGFYKLEPGPVCGSVFWGENTICESCGYEPAIFYNWEELFKEIYFGELTKMKNYQEEE